MKRSIYTLSAILLAATATPALAARDNMQWDTFKDVDVDHSGYLENGEYQSYAFGKADWDDDGYLENTEWARYVEVYYDPWGTDYDSYTQYDTDGDGYIDRSEFNEVPTSELYSAWDYDNDNLIDSSDWDQVAAYYQDKE